jgi:hypothetical protein
MCVDDAHENDTWHNHTSNTPANILAAQHMNEGLGHIARRNDTSRFSYQQYISHTAHAGGGTRHQKSSILAKKVLDTSHTSKYSTHQNTHTNKTFLILHTQAAALGIKKSSLLAKKVLGSSHASAKDDSNPYARVTTTLSSSSRSRGSDSVMSATNAKSPRFGAKNTSTAGSNSSSPAAGAGFKSSPASMGLKKSQTGAGSSKSSPAAVVMKNGESGKGKKRKSEDGASLAPEDDPFAGMSEKARKIQIEMLKRLEAMKQTKA